MTTELYYLMQKKNGDWKSIHPFYLIHSIATKNYDAINGQFIDAEGDTVSFLNSYVHSNTMVPVLGHISSVPVSPNDGDAYITKGDYYYPELANKFIFYKNNEWQVFAPNAQYVIMSGETMQIFVYEAGYWYYTTLNRVR